MIKNRNIALDAAIDITKIQGLGNMVIGETHYVAKDGIQARTWIQGRVDGQFIHATLQAANNACTASRGDVIYVLPGHTETVSAAAGIALNKAGITVIGVGNGTLIPTITLDTIISADIDIDAANITIVNMKFSANFADITAAIDVNATDFSMIGCKFVETATSMNALIWIQDAAAAASSRITIDGCFCQVVDAANTHFINFAGTPDGVIIKNNTLIGDWGTMAIGGAGVATNVVIVDNVIYNAASDNDSCINLEATVTGIVMRNLCGGAAAQANGVTATACAVAENYYGVISEDLSAILEPIAT